MLKRIRRALTHPPPMQTLYHWRCSCGRTSLAYARDEGGWLFKVDAESNAVRHMERSGHAMPEIFATERVRPY